jgi:hypothetical protein
VKFRFLPARDVAFPISTMCRVLDVSRSGFHAWQKRPKPERAKSDGTWRPPSQLCTSAVG